VFETYQANILGARLIICSISSTTEAAKERGETAFTVDNVWF